MDKVKSPRQRDRGCQVPGCIEELPAEKRYKICAFHSNLPTLMLSGRAVRWCQLCGRFQGLEEFVGDRKSCRRMLEQHNARRRRLTSQQQKLRAAAGQQQEQPERAPSSSSDFNHDAPNHWAPCSSEEGAQQAQQASSEGCNDSDGRHCKKSQCSAPRADPQGSGEMLGMQGLDEGSSPEHPFEDLLELDSGKGMEIEPPEMVWDQLLHSTELQEALAGPPRGMLEPAAWQQAQQQLQQQQLQQQQLQQQQLQQQQLQQQQLQQQQLQQQQLQQQHQDAQRQAQVQQQQWGYSYSPPASQQQPQQSLLATLPHAGPQPLHVTLVKGHPVQLVRLHSSSHPLAKGVASDAGASMARALQQVQAQPQLQQPQSTGETGDGGATPVFGTAPVEMARGPTLPPLPSEALPPQQRQQPQQQAWQQTGSASDLGSSSLPLAGRALGGPPPSQQQQQQQGDSLVCTPLGSLSQLHPASWILNPVETLGLGQVQLQMPAGMPALVAGVSQLGSLAQGAPPAPQEDWPSALGSLSQLHAQIQGLQSTTLSLAHPSPGEGGSSRSFPGAATFSPSYQHQQLSQGSPGSAAQAPVPAAGRAGPMGPPAAMGPSYQSQPFSPASARPSLPQQPPQQPSQQPQQQQASPQQQQQRQQQHLSRQQASLQHVPRGSVPHFGLRHYGFHFPAAGNPSPHPGLALRSVPLDPGPTVPSPVDFQEHVVQLSLKLFNVVPEDLPLDLQQEIANMVLKDPVFLATTLRPGCTFMSIAAVVCSEHDRLLAAGAEGLARQLQALGGWHVEQQQEEEAPQQGGQEAQQQQPQVEEKMEGQAWARDMLVQFGCKVAVVQHGRLTAVVNVQAVAPQLLAARPVAILTAAAAGERAAWSPSSSAPPPHDVVTLWGYNITGPQDSVVCRQGGRVLDLEVLARGCMPPDSNPLSPLGSSPEWVLVRPLGAGLGLLQFEVQRGSVLSAPASVVAVPGMAAVLEVQRAKRELASQPDKLNFIHNLGWLLLPLSPDGSPYPAAAAAGEEALPQASQGEGQLKEARGEVEGGGALSGSTPRLGLTRASVLGVGLLVKALKHNWKHLLELLTEALHQRDAAAKAAIEHANAERTGRDAELAAGRTSAGGHGGESPSLSTERQQQQQAGEGSQGQEAGGVHAAGAAGAAVGVAGTAAAAGEPCPTEASGSSLLLGQQTPPCASWDAGVRLRAGEASLHSEGSQLSIEGSFAARHPQQGPSRTQPGDVGAVVGLESRLRGLQLAEVKEDIEGWEDGEEG